MWALGRVGKDIPAVRVQGPRGVVGYVHAGSAAIGGMGVIGVVMV